MRGSRNIFDISSKLGNPWRPMGSVRGPPAGPETVGSFAPLREGAVRCYDRQHGKLGGLKDEVARGEDLHAGLLGQSRLAAHEAMGDSLSQR